MGRYRGFAAFGKGRIGLEAYQALFGSDALGGLGRFSFHDAMYIDTTSTRKFLLCIFEFFPQTFGAARTILSLGISTFVSHLSHRASKMYVLLKVDTPGDPQEYRTCLFRKVEDGLNAILKLHKGA